MEFYSLPEIVSSHYQAIQILIRDLESKNPDTDMEIAEDILKFQFGQREYWDSRIEELRPPIMECSSMEII